MKKITTRILLSQLLVCFAVEITTAHAPVINFTQIASGFSSPVDVVAANDGSNRLFVVEQGGRVKIIRNGSVLPALFFNIAASITAGGERGLVCGAVVFERWGKTS